MGEHFWGEIHKLAVYIVVQISSTLSSAVTFKSMIISNNIVCITLKWATRHNDEMKVF